MDPGTSGGANDETGSASATINISAVNDAPSGADASATINEDTPYVLGAADFGFVDVDANAFAGVLITAAPVAGSLYLDADGAGTGTLGTAISSGQMVSAADIAAGRLVYVPAADGHGAANGSFTFQVVDDGGTLDGGQDTDTPPTASSSTWIRSTTRRCTACRRAWRRSRASRSASPAA